MEWTPAFAGVTSWGVPGYQQVRRVGYAHHLPVKGKIVMKRIYAVLIILTVLIGIASAKVDLTTLPTRDTVQLTIYNSADMTLVRESRALTLKEGVNSSTVLLGEHTDRPDQPGDAAQGPGRQDRDRRAGVSAASEEPGHVEHPERGQRQGAGGDHVPDQRPDLAGLLHGHAVAGRKDDAAAGLRPRDEQQRRGL